MIYQAGSQIWWASRSHVIYVRVCVCVRLAYQLINWINQFALPDGITSKSKNSMHLFIASIRALCVCCVLDVFYASPIHPNMLVMHWIAFDIELIIYNDHTRIGQKVVVKIRIQLAVMYNVCAARNANFIYVALWESEFSVLFIFV